MPVRVYFPNVPQPREYQSAVVAFGKHSMEFRDGSLTIRDFGIHAQKDKEELIWPWNVVGQIKLQP